MPSSYGIHYAADTFLPPALNTRRPPKKLLLTALLLGSMATATLAQMATAVPTTKADCAKAKDMKWDEKGGKDGKGMCVKK